MHDNAFTASPLFFFFFFFSSQVQQQAAEEKAHFWQARALKAEEALEAQRVTVRGFENRIQIIVQADFRF